MKTLTTQEYVDGILAGNKIVLSRAITLLESTKAEHNALAREVIEEVLPHTGKSLRIGITGVPGVGKSTFIEAVGEYALQDGKLAVLAIDPSSQKSKGSILGDKTRMESLTGREDTFIRPSPAGDALGGVGRKTRETILLCEAAGFDTIFIETVGVGQSEISVHSMVDCFLLLMLPGAGDELQGIKRGIMEMADIIAINKAENERERLANQSARNYKNALHLMPPTDSGWIPKVMTCAAEHDIRIDKVWQTIQDFSNHQKVKGFFEQKRSEQNLFWFKETIQQHLFAQFYGKESIKQQIATLSDQVKVGEISSFKAADELIKTFFS
ncbi:MAG: methylmalonyl Co-A mutase-associated GTPase MeaB [Chitinophagales bacterium]